MIRQCDSCNAVIPKRLSACPSCGVEVSGGKTKIKSSTLVIAGLALVWFILYLVTPSVKPAVKGGGFSGRCMSSVGEVFSASAAIKERMHDPDSYEYVATRTQKVGNEWKVRVSFRGNNAFGAKVLSSQTFLVDFDCTVLSVVEDE